MRCASPQVQMELQNHNIIVFCINKALSHFHETRRETIDEIADQTAKAIFEARTINNRISVAGFKSTEARSNYFTSIGDELG